MAHDKTPERNNLIFFYTVLSVLTLILLGFVFTSYFNIETERVVTEHVRARPALDLKRAEREQEEALRTGPVPIDRAMQMLAREGRAPAVQPAPSDDLAPLEGWNEAVVPPRVPAALVPTEGEGVSPAEDEDEGEEAEAEGGEAGEGQEEVAPEGAMGDTSPSPQVADAPTEEVSEE